MARPSRKSARIRASSTWRADALFVPRSHISAVGAEVYVSATVRARPALHGARLQRQLDVRGVMPAVPRVHRNRLIDWNPPPLGVLKGLRVVALRQRAQEREPAA